MRAAGCGVIAAIAGFVFFADAVQFFGELVFDLVDWFAEDFQLVVAMIVLAAAIIWLWRNWRD